MNIESLTPAPFLVERSKLEYLLINSWLTFPSLRKTWTPDPSEFGTDELAALADACRWVAREHPEKNRELGLLIPAAMHAMGTLKRFPDASANIPVACHNQPAKGLERWRKLRCLIAARRSLVETLLRLTPDSDPSELNAAILGASSLTSVSGQARMWSDAESLALAVEQLRRNEAVGAFTGSKELDKQTGGIRQGHVWVLGAPTNWGKTNWLIGVSERYLGVHGSGVLLITCEDDEYLVSMRRLCRRAGIDALYARDGKASAADCEKAVDALRESAAHGKAPVLLDGRGRSVEDLAEDVKRLAKLHDLKLILVDYLQCIATAKPFNDRRLEIAYVARTLTDAIKTSGCAGVLASQLTDEHVRDSKDVEHAAEVVLIGRKSEDGELSAWLKKNKTGPVGCVVRLASDPKTAAFGDDYADEYSDMFEDA